MTGQRYALLITSAAARQIRALDKPTQVKVKNATEALRSEPRPHGCKKLAAADDLWRIRIGSYRVIYRIEDSALVVTVVKVGNRRDVYR